MHVSKFMNIVGSGQVPQNVDVVLVKFKKNDLCPDIVNLMFDTMSRTLCEVCVMGRCVLILMSL